MLYVSVQLNVQSLFNHVGSDTFQKRIPKKVVKKTTWSNSQKATNDPYAEQLKQKAVENMRKYSSKFDLVCISYDYNL